ncbi:hypothetical protein [Williamsia sp.]|uniref:hypothetical protein n=1 Tax=Williamsia sp. TaxID=1872085 RepID=UPI001A1E9625|nr:hypothetical protein [Williamsia sp.]MBJ7289186.1 hypothetical protein [Williamsia sp.]
MDNLPEQSDASTELSIDVEDDGLLVVGTPEMIDGYIARLRQVTKNEVSNSAVSRSDMGMVAGVAAGVANAAAQHGRYVKVSKQSMDLARAGKLVPAGGGYFRMTTVGAGNKFSGQMVWKPVVGSPARLASIQMIAIQMALTTALADVQKAIAKVDGKVDDLLALAKAQVIGDVVGNHSYLKRLASEVRNNNTLPTSDWESVASLGPELERGLEKLRSYLTATVSKLDPNAPLKDRAAQVDAVVTTNRLGESLQLLVVAQQTYYYWQHLRLRRVMDSEPKNREVVHHSVRAILTRQARLDAELWSQLHSRLNGFDKVKPLEIARFWDVDPLTTGTKTLQAELEDFRKTRGSQMLEWEQNRTPGVGEALDELGEIAGRAVGAGATVAAGGLRSLANMISRSGSEKPEKQSAEIPRSDAGNSSSN